MTDEEHVWKVVKEIIKAKGGFNKYVRKKLCEDVCQDGTSGTSWCVCVQCTSCPLGVNNKEFAKELRRRLGKCDESHT